MNVLNRNLDYCTKNDLQNFLKGIGSTYSFKTKDNYLQRVNRYKSVTNFTWREDQKKVIEEFIKFQHSIYVIHAVFGSGKTTLLLGMLIHGLIHSLFKPAEVLFVSFNISIKNEIKRKLSEYGISSKVTVRTFDSIIYEISKATEYPHIDLPNFEGKRKYVLKKVFENVYFKPVFQPSLIFVDECQDLEKNTLNILQYFYPKSKFVFAGDIFQSIQKEPRESLLWYFMLKDESPDVYKIYMNETPRVPPKTLQTLQTALKTYYPEFEEKIDSWKSSNSTSNADIEWRRLNSYNHIFDELKDFCREHTPEETMILTFSSAITVRGSMGDVARFRKFLFSEGFDVNTNHKRNDPNSYFLSTANSSKGLERDYVICFLTFPLEKAFVNLSDDIVVNLITVALTRAKKKVIIYVPSYEDKFSRVLNIFGACPKPNKKKIRLEDKSLDEFTYQNYLDLEHSVTELIRQGIIKYDTRIKLKNYAKKFKSESIFHKEKELPNVPKMITEEERAFVGVLIENLITSTWTNRWPLLSEIDRIGENPMYFHCIRKIRTLLDRYNNYIRTNEFNSSLQFEGVLIYSQVHIAISDKIFMDLSDTTKGVLRAYWNRLKPFCHNLKPNNGFVKIQSNLRMPWLTGVADAIISEDKEVSSKYREDSVEISEATILEIKASIDINWKDDALIQAILYSLMTGKLWSRIILLNPFRNEKVCYYYNSKNILTLRELVVSDILTYNFNSMMAKMYKSFSDDRPKINSDDFLYLHLVEKDGILSQAILVNFLSPIKCEILYNGYSYLEPEVYTENFEKIRCESDLWEKNLISEVQKILSENIYASKKIYTNFDTDKFGENQMIVMKDNFDMIKEEMNYKPDNKLMYSLNLNNGLHQTVLSLSYLFRKNKFV
jgi:hypothetical protein